MLTNVDKLLYDWYYFCMMKDEWWMMNDMGWIMNDEDLSHDEDLLNDERKMNDQWWMMNNNLLHVMINESWMMNEW